MAIYIDADAESIIFVDSKHGNSAANSPDSVSPSELQKLMAHTRRRYSARRRRWQATAIEAQLIAGHSKITMTGQYTKVGIDRQDETTRRIQRRMAKAKAKVTEIRRKEPAA